jgi:hypothetical protein
MSEEHGEEEAGGRAAAAGVSLAAVRSGGERLEARVTKVKTARTQITFCVLGAEPKAHWALFKVRLS